MQCSDLGLHIKEHSMEKYSCQNVIYYWSAEWLWCDNLISNWLPTSICFYRIFWILLPHLRPGSSFHGTNEANKVWCSLWHLSPWKTWRFLPTQHKRMRWPRKFLKRQTEQWHKSLPQNILRYNIESELQLWVLIEYHKRLQSLSYTLYFPMWFSEKICSSFLTFEERRNY